jgi:hypothetical protein
LSENPLHRPMKDDQGIPPVAAPLPSKGPEPTQAPADSVGDPVPDNGHPPIAGPVMNGSQTDLVRAPATNGRPARPCPFCYSTDTMEPFRRSPRVTVLSRIMPRLRWRYCRSCTHHFLTFAKRPNGH